MPRHPVPPRRPTDVALAAAAAARKAKAIAREADPEPDVAVFACRAGGSGFSWEIRLHGGILVERGEGVHATPEAARIAGRAVRDARGVPPRQSA